MLLSAQALGAQCSVGVKALLELGLMFAWQFSSNQLASSCIALDCNTNNTASHPHVRVIHGRPTPIPTHPSLMLYLNDTPCERPGALRPPMPGTDTTRGVCTHPDLSRLPVSPSPETKQHPPPTPNTPPSILFSDDDQAKANTAWPLRLATATRPDVQSSTLYCTDKLREITEQPEC
jgi:hypothetical protein